MAFDTNFKDFEKKGPKKYVGKMLLSLIAGFFTNFTVSRYFCLFSYRKASKNDSIHVQQMLHLHDAPSQVLKIYLKLDRFTFKYLFFVYCVIPFCYLLILP